LEEYSNNPDFTDSDEDDYSESIIIFVIYLDDDNNDFDSNAGD